MSEAAASVKILYWDAKPRDSSAVGSGGSSSASSSASATIRCRNLALLDRQGTCTTVSSFTQLANHLLSCSSEHLPDPDPARARPSRCRIKPLAIFVAEPWPSAVSTRYVVQALRFLALQFVHMPAIVTVLSDSRDAWPQYSASGATDTLVHILDTSAMTRIQAQLRVLVSAHRSRPAELKALLGLSSGSGSNANSSAAKFFTTATVELQNQPSLLQQVRLPLLTNRDSVLNRVDVRAVAASVRTWDFCAHKLSYNELLWAAVVMFERALAHPDLRHVHLPRADLLAFLLVVRDSYHTSNPYHNFRHAVDVLQATFFLLTTLGCFDDKERARPASPATADRERPRSPAPSSSASMRMPPVKQLLPAEILSILLVAIGHDVGHPGVTNAFLVAVQAPLARMYHDRSVLESFHTSAFLHILGQYWPQTLADGVMKRIIVDSILATDMGLHFDYMKQLDAVVAAPEKPISSTLIACILIKCADISNVTRPLNVSSRWGTVLAREFHDINELEVACGLKAEVETSRSVTTLQLAKGQLFFIRTYAKPLFGAVAKLFPQLHFTVDMITKNEHTWQRKLDGV